MNKELKNINRKLRVLKLHALVNAFSAFTQMELNRSLIFCKNSWSEAEKTRDLIHFFFPDWEVKVEEFLYKKDELSEKTLNYYNEFKSWLPITEFLGLPDKTVEAFCKNINATDTIWMLKTTGHLYYPIYFNALYKYLNCDISKKDLINSFVEYSLFDGKTTPACLPLFRRSIIRIEKLIDEILVKQATRSGMSVNEFMEESRLSKEELASIPF